MTAITKGAIYPNYLVREAEKDEIDELADFLEKYQTPEEVITQSFLRKNKEQITKEEEELIIDSTKQAVTSFPSLVAIDRHTKKIVATLLLVTGKSEPPKSTLFHECRKYVAKMLDISTLLPNVKKPLKLRLLAVHTDHRGRGLSKILLKKSLEWAEQNGFDCVYSLFTVLAAKRAAISTGFEKVVDYDLHEIRDSEGSRVFADASPNNVTWLMAVTIGP